MLTALLCVLARQGIFFAFLEDTGFKKGASYCIERQDIRRNMIDESKKTEKKKEIEEGEKKIELKGETEKEKKIELQGETEKEGERACGFPSGFKKFGWKKAAADLLYDIAGGVLYAAGIYTFAKNADFAPGGVSGLALILNALFHLPIGTTTLLLNIPLVAISYRIVGKRLLIKSAVSMFISSIILDGIFPFTPAYHGSPFMAALYSGVFLGAGMVLFYMRGSSSGGIDFLALSIKKKYPYLSIGVVTMLIDLGIILLGWPVFGNVDAVLYGVASTFISTIVIDKVLYGMGAGSLAIIITVKGEETAKRIGEITGRGTTAIPAFGTYTKTRKDVLLCACSKSQAYAVREAVHEADPLAFLMFTETSEVFGEGFKGGGAF